MEQKLNPQTHRISEFFRSRSLQTYISPVKLHNEQRLYRKVFEKQEISYMYVDFSFFNKKFDEEDWEAQIEFMLYRQGDQDEDLLDTTSYQQCISKDENIVLVTDNWGSGTPGEKWESGVYRYEAWINNDLAETIFFFVHDHGVVESGHNPYFNIYSLRLFESPAQAEEISNRQYMVCFRTDATRYIWAELEIQNLLQGKDWMGEFTFLFYNDARLLMGSQNVVIPVTTQGHNQSFRVEGGFGHETQITWLIDHYTLEVWFMGQKIATTAFEVGEKEKRGISRLEIPEVRQQQASEGEEQAPWMKDQQSGKNTVSEEHILKDLEHMVGLDSIRSRLKEYISFVRYQQLMKSKGMATPDAVNLHAVFMGNPGTGKTTVARTLGKIYHYLGLLPRDTVFEADRSSLIGRYIGETAPMTQEVIEKARGGILFIDEAYALSRKSDEKDFGKEALEVILREMSDGPGDLAVVVAGYPRQMQEFLNFNPGLRSRFRNIFEFPDYLPEELLQIALIKAKRKKLSVDSNAIPMLNQLLSEEYRKRDEAFGNARLVGSVIESAQLNLGVRIMKHDRPEKLPVETISTITAEDLQSVNLKPGRKKARLPVDEQLLNDTMNQIKQMTGISKVKQEIQDLIKLVRYHREINKDILHTFSLHNVFMGNPGTGKTTVARLMARVFKALGVLERGHLVECNRESFVAGHVGQTAIKTQQLINDAMGGVLFIDEAYSLVPVGNGHDFGKEAIEILLKSMEDNRGQFAVIMAGYTREMQVFLDSNPGLRSRIDNHVLFEDYSAQELGYIAQGMFRDHGMKPVPEALQVLVNYFAMHVEHRDRFFGNARFVRKVVEKVVRNQLLRMGSTLPKERTLEMMQTILPGDVKEFTEGMDVLQAKPGIGFSTTLRKAKRG